MTIYGLDEFSVHAEMLPAFETRYRDVYVPLARDRGMTLEHAWITPPAVLGDAPNSLLFIWSVPDAPAWWRMRYGAYEPKVAAFWADVAPLVITRRRIFLGPLPSFSALTHV
jgi:hypothetical protein